jgi:hypothetical protein
MVALLDVVIGITGLVSPNSLMAIRRNYLATPVGFYVVGAVSIASGLVLILFAPASRMPKILRILGVVLCLRGIAAPIFGTVDRGRAILDWETMQGPVFLGAGAVVALLGGAFVAFAAMGPRSGPARRAS